MFMRMLVLVSTTVHFLYTTRSKVLKTPPGTGQVVFPVPQGGPVGPRGGCGLEALHKQVLKPNKENIFPRLYYFANLL